MMELLKKKGLFLLNKVDDGSISPSNIVLDLPLSGNTNDISGNNHTVVDNSIIYYPDGALFDLKTTDYIRVSDNNDLSFTTNTTDKPFSVSFDIIFDDFTSTRRLICKGNSSGVYEYFVQFWNGQLGLLLFNGGTGTRYVYKVLTTNIFTLGVPYNIVITYDGRGGVNANVGINIYINGGIRTDVVSTPDAQYVCMTNTTTNLCIGHLGGETSLVFTGSIKNVRIYNIALSQLQVDNLQPINTVEASTTKLFVPFYGNILDNSNNTKSLVSGGSAQDYLTKPRWLKSGTNVYQQITAVGNVINMQMNGNSLDTNGHTVNNTDISYVNNTALFNGTTSKITISNSSDLSFTNGINDLPFSIDIKFTLNSLSNTPLLFKVTNTSGTLSSAEYGLYYYGGQLYFTLYSDLTHYISIATVITFTVGVQ